MGGARQQGLPDGVCALALLLAAGVVALWQLARLQRGSSLPLEHAGPAAVLAKHDELRDVVGGVTVLAESPLDLLAAPLLTPAGAPAGAPTSGPGQPNFPAEGPLDHLLGSDGDAPGSAAEEGGDGHGSDGTCNDVHPNADSPDMLNVVYASDTSQVEGVQASVASVVASAAAPEQLSVHIMVQKKWAKEFKERFGLRPECQGTVTVTGVLIKVHAVDAKLIERAVASVLPSVRKERGAIDAVENFVRFYMHLVLQGIVIYLDADTIVQADLGKLRKQLFESRKTVGFVARESVVKMDKFLRKPPQSCDFHFPNWKKLIKSPAYNVGVFVVDLQRWKDQRVYERVEAHVAQHNGCGGKLWVGGSQPPLLLAFLSRPEGTPEDYIVYDAAWNTGDLGWREGMSAKKLRTKFVLHWNGNRKPWKREGLYKELWLPHREQFRSLLRPYDSGGGRGPGGDAAPSSKEKKARSTTTLSPEEIAARAACPHVDLLDDWTDAAEEPCRIGKTYGCAGSGPGMWTKAGCRGIFRVSGNVTTCGGWRTTPCLPGDLPVPAVGASCGLMILTSYFTTKKDWQRGKYAKVSFSKIQKLYQTVIRNGLNVTLLYDSIPDDFIRRYECARFRFHRVNLSEYDTRYGVNDVRYFFFHKLVSAHAEWGSVFIIDAFDVRVGMNPCPGIGNEKTLYIGSEQDKLKKHPWMKARFSKMGGKYNKWYKAEVTPKMKILNCGITGGRRKPMLKLLRRMTEVLSDPDIAIMKKKESINLNMASLNYILYTEFSGKFVVGPPVHSTYKRFETKRKDVWFIHK